jgi:preprotein translocase subunit YajC
MLNTLILFAQVAEEEGKKVASEPPPFWQNSIFLVPVLFALFYFVVLRPQHRKQRKEQEDMMASLKKNDEVITAAGIIGIVSHIKDSGDEVTLKIDDNARIRVLRSTIVRILKKEESPKDGTAATTTPAANTNIKPMT